MSLNQSLSAELEKLLLQEPDSDGDTRIEGSLILKAGYDQILELFITQQVLRNSDGAIIASSRDELEDSLSSEGVLSLDLYSGYFKSKALGNSSVANIDIEVLGCKADYVQLPSIHLGDGAPGLYGWNQEVGLGANVIIESLAVGVKKPDEDGDVCIELRALVCNTSGVQVPKFVFKAKAIASGGREIEDTSTYEAIAPGERRVIELSFYSIKANRINGLSITADATSFSVQGKASASCEVGTTN